MIIETLIAGAALHKTAKAVVGAAAVGAGAVAVGAALASGNNKQQEAAPVNQCAQSGCLWEGCRCLRCGNARNEMHSWNRCRCLRCDAVRTEGHDFEKISGKCLQRCGICTTTAPRDHKWAGCTCKRCGEVRDEQHTLEAVPGKCATVCAVCAGARQSMPHAWAGCTCDRCGEVRNQQHAAERVTGRCEAVCTVCSAREALPHKLLPPAEGECAQVCEECSVSQPVPHKWEHSDKSVCLNRCTWCAITKTGSKHDFHQAPKTCVSKCTRCAKSEEGKHTWIGHECAYCDKRATGMAAIWLTAGDIAPWLRLERDENKTMVWAAGAIGSIIALSLLGAGLSDIQGSWGALLAGVIMLALYGYFGAAFWKRHHARRVPAVPAAALPVADLRVRASSALLVLDEARAEAEQTLQFAKLTGGEAEIAAATDAYEGRLAASERAWKLSRLADKDPSVEAKLFLRIIEIKDRSDALADLPVLAA